MRVLFFDEELVRRESRVPCPLAAFFAGLFADALAFAGARLFLVVLDFVAFDFKPELRILLSSDDDSSSISESSDGALFLLAVAFPSGPRAGSSYS